MIETPTHRIDGWTAVRQTAFIETLAFTGSVTQAAQAAEMSVSSAYRLRGSARGVEFRRDWVAALGVAHARVHELAMERMTEGTEVPVWYKGELVGFKKVISDRLLMFMLDRLDPDRLMALLPPEPHYEEPVPPIPAATLRMAAAMIGTSYEASKARGECRWQQLGKPDPYLVLPDLTGDEDLLPEDPESRHPVDWELADAQRRWAAIDMAREMGTPCTANLEFPSPP